MQEQFPKMYGFTITTEKSIMLNLRDVQPYTVNGLERIKGLHRREGETKWKSERVKESCQQRQEFNLG